MPMASDRFKAIMLTQEEGETHCAIETLTDDLLPEGDVLVAVEYSSLNYKDGLAVTGKGKVVRHFPMVPGIDLAGSVVESVSADFRPGDKVLLTGWGIGERHWGGYSQRQRVRSDWLLPLPDGLDTKSAMVFGTAGFTAMLSVMTLEEAGVSSDEKSPILVTGASGGVGSLAVLLLAALGHQVAAVTGRPENHEYLRELGAGKILDRQVMAQEARPLESERWAGVVDTVGGSTLARALAECGHDGCVAACGLAGGAALATTVMPFILRGVSLRGVDSAWCGTPRRKQAWQRLARLAPADLLEKISRRATLEEIPQLAENILRGRIRGRVVVDVNG
jgi:acrylyl-CoA reductase (NADPH)